MDWPANSPRATRLYLAAAISILAHAVMLASGGLFAPEHPPRWSHIPPLELRLSAGKSTPVAPRQAAAESRHPIERQLAQSEKAGAEANSPPAAPASFGLAAPVSGQEARAAGGQSAAAVTGQPAAAAAPAEVDEAWAAPDYSAAYLDNPPPVYPQLARRMGIEGEVRLKVRVASDGAVLDVVLARSSGHDSLDAAAINALQRWKFVPARRGTSNVEAWVVVPLKFRLAD